MITYQQGSKARVHIYGNQENSRNNRSEKGKEHFFCKRRFNEFAIKNPIVQVEKPSIPLSITEVSFENYELIQKFSPFGESWKKPIFNLENIRVGSLRYSRDEKHIITPIGTNSKITGFNISKESLSGLYNVNLVGNLRVSTYKMTKSLEFLISEVK